MDRASFQRWYEQSAPALRSYLRYTCRDPALADDLLQETWLRLLRTKLPVLDEAERKSYLYKTAHSALADHFRKTKREQTRIGKVRDAVAAAAGAVIGSGYGSGSGYGADSDVGNGTGADTAGADLPAWIGAVSTSPAPDLPLDIERALAGLMPRDRQILWLACVEEFSHREIAPLIGVQENSVRVLLLRARHRLAAILTAQGLGPEEGT